MPSQGEKLWDEAANTAETVYFIWKESISIDLSNHTGVKSCLTLTTTKNTKSNLVLCDEWSTIMVPGGVWNVLYAFTRLESYLDTFLWMIVTTSQIPRALASPIYFMNLWN